MLLLSCREFLKSDFSLTVASATNGCQISSLKRYVKTGPLTNSPLASDIQVPANMYQAIGTRVSFCLGGRVTTLSSLRSLPYPRFGRSVDKHTMTYPANLRCIISAR